MPKDVSSRSNADKLATTEQSTTAEGRFNKAKAALSKATIDANRAKSTLNRELKNAREANEAWKNYRDVEKALKKAKDDSNQYHVAASDCFERAKIARKSGDAESVSKLESEAKANIEQRNSLNLEVKHLIDELKKAHEYARECSAKANRPALEQAKTDSREANSRRMVAKQEFEAAKIALDALKSARQKVDKPTEVVEPANEGLKFP